MSAANGLLTGTGLTVNNAIDLSTVDDADIGAYNDSRNHQYTGTSDASTAIAIEVYDDFVV